MWHVPQSAAQSDGWWELHNVYHSVWMPPGISKGFGVKELWVYAQPTDGHGAVNLGLAVDEVDLANQKRNRRVGLSDPVAVTFQNPWVVHEVVFQMEKVPFPRPGQYQFRLLEGGTELEGGSTFLRVMPGDPL